LLLFLLLSRIPVMARPHAVAIKLSVEDLVVFDNRLKAHTTPQRDVFRMHIVLLASQGYTNDQIADHLACHPDTVRKWRQRFAQHGRDGLVDQPRPGRPRAFSPSTVRCHHCSGL
jgi:DNA-directed RNA polymerase specialized sigma24 family protein